MSARFAALVAAVLVGAGIGATVTVMQHADPGSTVTVPAGEPFDYVQYVDGITGRAPAATAPASIADMMIPGAPR